MKTLTIQQAISATCGSRLYELSELRVAVDDDVALRCEYARAERALAEGDSSLMRMLCRTLERLTGESYSYAIRMPVETPWNFAV